MVKTVCWQFLPMWENHFLAPDRYLATNVQKLSHSLWRTPGTAMCPTSMHWKHNRLQTVNETCMICAIHAPSLSANAKNINGKSFRNIDRTTVFHICTFSILLKCSAYLSCALNCMNRIFELCDSSVILFMLGKNLLKRIDNNNDLRQTVWNGLDAVEHETYLNIFCTATIVLQSDRLSSSAEFDSSLLTTTTFSASVIPPRSKSSKQSIEPSIQ